MTILHHPASLRRAFCVLCASLCCLVFPVVSSAQAPAKSYDIPAGPAMQTLKQFIEQSDEQLLYSADAVQGIRTNAVSGQFTARAALDKMVNGTGLAVVQDPQNGALSLVKKAANTNAQTVVLGTASDPPGQAIGAVAAPSAGSEEESIVKLPAFTVTSTRQDDYNAAEASSFARTVHKILDTPLTAYVITPMMVQNVDPTSLFGVTNYFGGVSPGRGTGTGSYNERQTLRGFESFSRTVDNFSHGMIPFMYAPFSNYAPVFIEHAELIMGPDTILSPTGAPGGTISAFTKSPQFTRGTDVSVEVGNYNANRVSIDSTGPLGTGQHMAYRIIGSYQDAQTYLPGAVINYAGAAELTYKFSDTAKLMLKYFGTEQRTGGVIADSTANGEMIYTPDTVGGVTISSTPQPGFQYRGWNGDATWSHMITRDNVATAELTAALGERINMRLAGQIYYSNSNLFRAYPAPSFTEKWDPNTGQQISVTPIDPTALSVLAAIQHVTSRQIAFQNDFAGNFKVGGVSLHPLAGWAYQRGQMPNYYTVQNKNMPKADLRVGYYDPPVPLKSTFTTNASNTPGTGWTVQVYNYLRVGFFNDRLFLVGGAGRTWAGVHCYVLPYTITGDGTINAGTPGPVVEKTFSSTKNSLSPSVQPWHDSYIAGALYKVLPTVSVYYNFSTNAGLASEAALWQAGVQNEFGIKGNFFNNRISVTASHFKIHQNNVSYANPLLSTGQSNIAFIYTDLVNQGEEFNITGGITKDLSVVFSYTNQKLRDFVGRRQRNVPDNMANLLLHYRFNMFNSGAAKMLKNSGVFVGVNHQGDVAGENATGFTPLGVPQLPGYYVPGYTVVNAGASYQYGKYRYNLNVDNILDKKFWWQAQGRSSLAPWPGITVRFRVTKHF
jgi:outer membrane receptor for monomeric catechols